MDRRKGNTDCQNDNIREAWGGFVVFSLGETRSDYVGFGQLTRLARDIGPFSFDKVDIDMSGCSWFDANMAAPLGALLYRSKNKLNNVRILGIPTRIEEILRKNEFLRNYGRPPLTDANVTTIPYRRFEPSDSRYFGSYISEYWRGRGVPEMSEELRKKFLESFFELFNNAVIHSETKLGIYSCGQYYPAKQRLDFSIVDLGMGIRENLRRRKQLDLSPDKAIEWAVSGNHTTRTGPVPGGLGLKLLADFTMKNGGCIQIVSDRGYWELKAGNSHSVLLGLPFPGTVVNIELNTGDTRSYRLSSESNLDDIF
jgi:hypothetical protein